METRKHCPLSFRCQEEKCAWWIESQKCCAIVTRNKPFLIGVDLNHSEVQDGIH